VSEGTAVAGCVHCGGGTAAMRATTEAVLSITSQLAVEPILRRIVESARELADAHYAALGVPDEGGGFAKFLTAGITDAQWAAIGDLPRTHGVLGDLMHDPTPVRMADVHDHPHFWGWPDAHPSMRSYLGVPIVMGDDILGAIYLNNKAGGGEFTAEDEEVIKLLAAHAAIALNNARLYERSRELTVIEERNRLARELHDAVAQTLFSVRLTAEAAAALVTRDPVRAEAQIRRLAELSAAAIAELRSVIFELRPAELADDGLVVTLRKHVDVLRRAHAVDVTFDVDVERLLDPDVETSLFRIAQEALNNALLHAQPRHVAVLLRLRPPGAVLEVRDDGGGFDVPEARRASRRLGLTSMEERAEAIGGALVVDSAPGAGTTVRVTVPDG